MVMCLFSVSLTENALACRYNPPSTKQFLKQNTVIFIAKAHDVSNDSFKGTSATLDILSPIKNTFHDIQLKKGDKITLHSQDGLCSLTMFEGEVWLMGGEWLNPTATPEAPDSPYPTFATTAPSGSSLLTDTDGNEQCANWRMAHQISTSISLPQKCAHKE